MHLKVPSMSEVFAAAHAARGSDKWEEIKKSTGAGFQTIGEAGDKYHDLDPDLTQSNFSRICWGRMHLLGIVDNLFRRLLWAAAPAEERCLLAYSKQMMRQARGTPGHKNYVRLEANPSKSQEKQSSKVIFANEKSHDKRRFRQTRLMYDMLPLYKADTVKAAEFRRVRHGFSFD